MKKLTDEERRVIEDRATEAPFSGKYNDFFKPGIYVCKRCGNPLFSSKAKFEAGCGWPSFDEDLGRVERKLDEDGIRTEISCGQCGAHLGHVFEGEKFTNKDTRHCVNSLSLEFVPKNEIAEKY